MLRTRFLGPPDARSLSRTVTSASPSTLYPPDYDGGVSDTPQPESTAGALVGRRLAGIALDWLLCLVISSAFFVDAGYDNAGSVARVLLAGDPNATLIIWAAQHLVLVSLLGTTIGHRVMGLRVVREDAAPYVGPLKGLGRTVLLALVIPAVVWGPDGRGLHDRAMGTRIVDVRAARRA